MVDSGKHYDDVANLFETLLGENLHVGYFEHPNLSLHEASTALTRFMTEQVGLQTGCKILDVGCGVGGPARYLAAHYQASVLGISNSAECIARASLIKHPMVNYLCMDALCLANSELTDFDVAWLLESSHLMDDKSLLFQGLNKVTAKQGKFVLCDFFLNDEAFATDRRNILKMRKIYKVFGRLDLTPSTFYQLQAEKNGFEKIRISDITEKTSPTLEYWLQEADNRKNDVNGWREFIEGVEFLQELYQNQIVSYHVISGEKL